MPKRKSPTAETVLADYLKLSKEEREKFNCLVLLKDPESVAARLVEMLRGFTAYGNNLWDRIHFWEGEVNRRTPKKRKKDRDEYIVYLKDTEKLSFGKIPRRLKEKDPTWCEPDGRPLDVETVKKGYYRTKEKKGT